MSIPFGKDADDLSAGQEFGQASKQKPEIEDDGFITVHVSAPLAAAPKPEEPR